MAWIESHQNLLNHPKTLNLMSLMNWDVDTTIGKLHRLWWWCIEYAPDGDLRKHNAPTLAAALGLRPKRAKELVRALLRAGWLDKEPYFRVHNWWEHIGMFLRSKYKRHPEVWQRVRDSYESPTSSDADEQVYWYSTGENAPSDRYCAVPPNLTKHNITNKTKHPPHLPSRAPARDDDDAADDGAGAALTEFDTRSQEGSDADVTETEDEPNGLTPETSGPLIPAGRSAAPPSPGNGTKSAETLSVSPPPMESELTRIIRDRIGTGKSVSPFDMRRIAALKDKHGTRFDDACDRLHGGVDNVPSYLQAILEPRDRSADLARKVRELAIQKGINFKESS